MCDKFAGILSNSRDPRAFKMRGKCLDQYENSAGMLIDTVSGDDLVKELRLMRVMLRHFPFLMWPDIS